MRTILFSALLLFGFVLVGCDKIQSRPTAVGQEGSVFVVIDSTTWNGPVGEALRQEISYPIATLPAPEPAFGLQRYPLLGQASLNRIKMQKNLLFVSALSDSTVVTQLISSLFSEEALQAVNENDGALVVRDDPWRLRQKVGIIAAPSEDHLVDVIRRSGKELRDGFNTITRERTELDMFRKGRQVDLENQIFEKHDFALKVQHDYQIAVDTTDFIWLRRILSSDSWRSVFVHYIENGNPAEMSPEWIYSVRDSLTHEYVRGNLNGFVEIDRRRPLITENISFLGNFGYETRGLWQMMEMRDGEKQQAGMGGPFVTYTFYDQDSGRIYLVDGMVFAPGYDKREFLRQVEVMAYTFRDTQLAEGDQPVAVASDDRVEESLLASTR